MLKLVLFLAFLSLGGGLPGQEGQDAAPTLDRQQVESGLAEARSELQVLPEGAEADSPEALLRQAWERRAQLLEEAVQLLTHSEGREAAVAGLDARRLAHLKRLSDYENSSPVQTFDSPTDSGFAELDAKVAAQRDRVTSLRVEEAERARFVEQIPGSMAQARARLQAALERGTRLAQEGEAATDATQKEILQIRASSAGVDAEVARLQSRVLDGDRELERSLAPLRREELDLAEKRLERLEEEYRLYGQALEQESGREGVRLEKELKRLESALAAAQGPLERFVVGKQLEMTLFDKNRREHGRLQLSIGADLEEQQQRLTVEVEELRSLREYLDKAGTGEQAGERIKYTMQRVKLRRQALKRTLGRDIASELSPSRSRRFELEDKLFFLKEAWEQEVEARALELSGPEAKALRAAADDLFELYRDALRKERDQVTELIGVGQELQVALIERREALDALEAFIRSKVFWIRDGKPIGPALLSRVRPEAEVVTAWVRDLGSAETSSHIFEKVTRPRVLAALFFLLIGLPVGLFWVRQRLRRFVTRMNDRTLRNDARLTDRLLAIGAGVFSVALLPVYIFIASGSIDAADLPETLRPVLASLLDHLAIFLLFWFLSRSFFAGRGTAQVQFGMDSDAAHNLHRSLCIVLVGYVTLFTARSILSRPPFVLDSLPLEVLPRLSYILFVAVVTVAGILLLQPRSAFSRNWATALGDTFLGRRWPFIGSLMCLGGVGIVVLEVTGRRYSAGVLGKNLVLSLAALFVLVPLYKGVTFAIESYALRRRERRQDSGGEGGQPSSAEDPGSQVEEGQPGSVAMEGHELQIRKFLRVLFIVGGVVLVASLWGIDKQAFDALDQLPAYDIRGAGEGDESVSYGDLLRAILYVLGTYFLLKYLPGIYEYGVFSRLDLDSGLKYAILTMSRYGLFTFGVIVVLSAIHLDLGRLGWLMAAMGVGLGFGLQEIVSNFVSGIILLVERPVRVGDVVTIGTTSGKVQRINIRATSVINFDRQEIIVPNRSLITKEVTNWTRGDTIIRLVVPIGVAYGTDVDLVTNMLLEIAREETEILSEPPPQAFFLAHGESSLNFELRVFIPDPSTKMPLLHRLNRTINRRLADQGIEIPFPQRDLHLRSSATPWPLGGPGGKVEEQTLEKA